MVILRWLTSKSIRSLKKTKKKKSVNRILKDMEHQTINIKLGLNGDNNAGDNKVIYLK